MPTVDPSRKNSLLALVMAGSLALSGIALPTVAHASTFDRAENSIEYTDVPAARQQGPIIVEQPQPQVVELGNAAELGVRIDGEATVRWQRATEVYEEQPDTPEAWADIDLELQPSAAEKVLRFERVTTEDDGIYRLVASGTEGEATSEPVRLAVVEPAFPELPILSPVEDSPLLTHPSETAFDEAPQDGAQPSALAAAQSLPKAPIFWDNGRGVVDLNKVLFSAYGPTNTSNFAYARLSGLVDPGTGDGRPLQAWSLTSQEDPESWRYPYDIVDGEVSLPWTFYSTEAEESHQLTISVGYADNGEMPAAVLYQATYEYRTGPMIGEPKISGPQDASVKVGEPVEFVFTASGTPVPYVGDGQQFWKLVTADGLQIVSEEMPESWKNVFPVEQQPRNGEFHYRIAAVTPEMDGMTLSASYKNCGIFGNGFCESPAVKLTVTDYQQPSDWRAPSVTKSPENVVMEPEGDETIVRLFAEGDLGNPVGTLNWQWRKGSGAWKDIEQNDASGEVGGFDGMLILSLGEQHNGNSYRAVYRNRLGVAYSEAAQVLLQRKLPPGSYWGQSDPTVILSVPLAVSEDDESITISGRRWLDPSQKNTGSAVTVRISGMENPQPVHDPVTGELLPHEVLAAVKASKTGRWLVEIPKPEGLEVGRHYNVTIRSGELQQGDAVREERADFVAAPAYELAEITRDLPEEFVIHSDEDRNKLSIEADASTPITYRWEYQPRLGEKWFSFGEYNDGWTFEGNVLTAPAWPAAGRPDLDGGKIRVALSTNKGTIYSKPATVRFSDAGQQTLTYDTSRSYTYGDTIEVSGTGFTPNSLIPIAMLDGYGDFETDSEGNLAGSFTIPGAYPQWDPALELEVEEPVLPGRYSIRAGGFDLEAGAAIGPEFVLEPDPNVAPPAVEHGFNAVTTINEGETHVLAPTFNGEVIGVLGSITVPESGDWLGSWSDSTAEPIEVEGLLENHGAMVNLVAWSRGGAVRLESVIEVIPADGAPTYPHVTGTSTVESDEATVWVERDAEAGKSVRISGRDWTDESGKAGSLIAVKLNYEQLTGQTGQYERTGSDIVLHPKNGNEEATIWKLIQANADGSFGEDIDLPENVRAGQRLTMTVTSGVFKDGDVSRSIVTPPLVVGGIAWEEDEIVGGVCEPSTEKPTWNVQEQAKLGGTLKISGQGWCHPTNGGSTIAIKIDDGAYSHLTDDLHDNRTIWDIVYADDETGDWEVDITLPDGTTSGTKGSAPAFPEGAHSIRLLTGTLKEGDAIRTVGTPTGQNTTFVVGEYRPNALPSPLDIEGGALTEANKNGVTVTQQQAPAPGQWTVTVPGGKQGDWVYVDAYAGPSSRGYFPEWKQLDANGQVTLSLAGVTLAVGDLNVTVQSENQAHVGELLGWAQVTIEKPKSQLPPVTVPNVVPPRVVTPPPPGVAPTVQTPTPTTAPVARVAAAQSTAPATIPEQPVKRGSQLDASNAGQVTGLIEGDVVTLTVADGEPNQWIYAYIYTGVQVRPIGWVQLDADKQMKVDISELPDGNHKIALVSVDGTLVGWSSAAKGKITAAQLQQEKADEVFAQNAEEEAAILPPVLTGMPGWMVNTLLSGGALLLIAAAAMIAFALRNRREQAR